ncbi:hypothetical protein BKA66DRAFT_436257 [Pyrenochaeta sp. MPI-SDFR-AT-0127]|nr:hypothetical protein BKA66DRAFT_436257 [Pyrenochaeta sp. MPI-SDFR-AT-0127]
MGTRGYFVYKWHGRYYVFYNHLDSYPEGLGETLVAMIPSEPTEYRKWLERKRAEYTDAEARLNKTIFTVNQVQASNGQMLPLSACGVDDLACLPDYNGPPQPDWNIKWVYVIDLDREIFCINGNSYFYLPTIPKHWVTLLENAERFHSAAFRQARLAWIPEDENHIGIAADTGITSSILPMLHTRGDNGSAYDELSTSFVAPKQSLLLSKRPITTVARHVLKAMLKNYSKLLRQAQYATPTEDFIFREAAYTLLCTCSCSPLLLRMVTRTRETEETLRAPFAMLQPLEHDKVPEFASAIFQGYHLENNRPGSAPVGTTYWLLGVLISLNRDLTSENRIKSAIVDVVNYGKNDGRTRFNAIIISIAHVVLVRVAGEEIQHTKRLHFVDTSRVRDVQADEPNRQAVADGQIVEGDTDHRTPDETMQHASEAEKQKKTAAYQQFIAQWEDNENLDTFSALTHIFEATARESLYPSGTSLGIFPNEVYENIIAYVDPATRLACLTVSIAFRDFASTVFCMSNELKLISQPESVEPLCYHAVAGNLGPFQLIKPSEAQDTLHWIPTIGHCDGTASFVPDQALTLAFLKYNVLPAVTGTTVDEDMSHMPRYLGSIEVSSEYTRVYMESFRNTYFGQNTTTADVHSPCLGYDVFQRLLPSQQILVSSGDVMGLHCAAFFHPMGIFGCGPGSNRHNYWHTKPMKQIGITPRNTCMYLGGRRTAKEVEMLAYGLAWAKQPCEDSPECWDIAISEAMECATKDFEQYQQRAWLIGRDVTDDDFAILVMIGRRFRFFHRRALPGQKRIPRISAFPDIEEKFKDYFTRREYDSKGCAVWGEAGITTDQINMHNSLGWEPIYEMRKGAESVPLDPLEESHRPQIEKAYRWLQALAELRSETEDTMM